MAAVVSVKITIPAVKTPNIKGEHAFLGGSFKKLTINEPVQAHVLCISIATNKNKEYDVEDIVIMSFKTDMGVIGTANFNSLALDKMIIYGTKGKIEFSMHGNDAVIITTVKGEEKIEIDNPKIIQESMVENVVKSLLTGKHLNTCPAREAIETYRIMDIVLEKYYHGRNDDFWNRIDSWNKN